MWRNLSMSDRNELFVFEITGSLVAKLIHTIEMLSKHVNFFSSIESIEVNFRDT